MSKELARSLLLIAVAGIEVTVVVFQKQDRDRRKLVLAPGADPPLRSTPSTKVLTGLMGALFVLIVLVSI